jgi:outer membrane protein assembly factor BamB
VSFYVGSSAGRLYALDRVGGHVVWSFPTGDNVWTSPAVVDGVVYFGSHDGFIYAIGRGE